MAAYIIRSGVLKLPLRSCITRQYASIGGGIHIAQDYSLQSKSAHHVQNSCMNNKLVIKRSFSSGGNNSHEDTTNKGNSIEDTTNKPDTTDKDNEEILGVIYEGPFAQLTLRLKRISLTSAFIGLVGLPAYSVFQHSAIPPTGQLAVIATAGITAVGSTALLGYCFSPYVHTIERLPAASNNEEESESGSDIVTNDAIDKHLIKIVTRDILARRVETIFDPTTEVYPPPNNNSRPFCNFMVGFTSGKPALPMYVHPELVHDYKLRVQLVGEPPKEDDVEASRKKTDDDEFL